MSKTIEELQEEIDELTQTIDDHSDELSAYENAGYEKAMLEMEGKIENAFNSGFKSSECKCSSIGNGQSMLKSFLNYQMEQRL